MDPLTMFSCPFRHDATLQQYRLLSVTTTVTTIIFSARAGPDPPKISLVRLEAMYACVSESGGGFFEGVYAPSNATAYFYDLPPPSNRRNRSRGNEAPARSGSISELAWAALTAVIKTVEPLHDSRSARRSRRRLRYRAPRSPCPSLRGVPLGYAPRLCASNP
jgi:hypothetical protein